MLVSGFVLLFVVYCVEAGRTHYYGGPGYPTDGSVYNSNGFIPYYKHVGAEGFRPVSQYAYGGYDDGYGKYSSYPYGYEKQVVIPTDYVHSPLAHQYVDNAPIRKSLTATSLYQTHPSPYEYNNGYSGGGYGYASKYGGNKDYY